MKKIFLIAVLFSLCCMVFSADSISFGKESAVSVGEEFVLDTAGYDFGEIVTDREDVIVQSNGVYTAIGEGVAKIGGFDYNSAKMVYATVYVTDLAKAVIKPQELILSETEIHIYVNEKGSVIPTVLPENATDKSITWTSSKPDVLAVGQSGKNVAYKGLKAGASYIVGTCNGNPNVKALCKVLVENKLPTDIYVSDSVVNVYTYEYYELTGYVIPQDSTNKTVLWSTSDKGIAYVNCKGRITGVREGVAYVTATAKGNPSVTKKIKVNVKWCPPREIEISQTEAFIQKKEYLQLSATILPDYAHNKTVIWSSSDKSIASVTSKGLVYGGKDGTVTITATAKGDPNVKAVCRVRVGSVVPSEIILDKKEAQIIEGGSFTLKATVLPEDASDKSIKWTSSAPTVATVNNGVVTALKSGTATITAETVSGKKTDSCTVTVVPDYIKKCSFKVTYPTVTESGAVVLSYSVKDHLITAKVTLPAEYKNLNVNYVWHADTENGDILKNSDSVYADADFIYRPKDTGTIPADVTSGTDRVYNRGFKTNCIVGKESIIGRYIFLVAQTDDGRKIGSAKFYVDEPVTPPTPNN